MKFTYVANGMFYHRVSFHSTPYSYSHKKYGRDGKLLLPCLEVGLVLSMVTNSQ